jgi:hypothetical protein
LGLQYLIELQVACPLWMEIGDVSSLSKYIYQQHTYEVAIDWNDMMNKFKNIYEIVFNLKKSDICNTMLKTISFSQSCTSLVYIYDTIG